MRKIVTAVSAAALSLSMLASAVPALAVSGYDSAYAGESAFVNISPGQTQNFQVFFANTGTTTWSRGTGTQVDLAACLDDKTTCNAQDASEAAWNSGWLSSTRYASTVQTTTAPGALATFSYNVTAPVGATNGTYRFNGDLVLSSTGEKIHPEGYYQDATIGGVSGGAAVLTSMTPISGTSNGGTPVTITGTGIVCTPAFPAVSFGGTNAVVTSCGSTSVGATSPAHAPGAVTVTLTNSGQAASNGLTYTFQDTTKPVFTAVAVTGDVVTVTFSEPVCRDGAWTQADWRINNVSSGVTDITDTGDSIPLCSATTTRDGVTSANVIASQTVTPGAFVEVTLNETVINDGTGMNIRIADAAGNAAAAPQARQATAGVLETTPPTLTSATGAVGATTVTVNFSEPVYCTGLDFGSLAVASTDISISDSDTTTVDPTVVGAGSNLCPTTRSGADTSFSFNLSKGLLPDKTYTVTLTPETNEIQDAANNDLANPSSVSFVSGAADFTPPTLTDARVTNNLGTTDWGFNNTGGTELGDSFSLTFSETMSGTASTAATGSMQAQDQDGTVITFTCGTNVSCTWNSTVTGLSVVVIGTITTSGVGSTPGMQIPFNITTMNGFTDLQGNVPNILGSSDRLVDYEF
jgi:IPT/TIG domain/Bacterial Ig-like domain